MTNWQAVTTATYDASAQALADYFQGTGPRTLYIALAFKLLNGTKTPLVLEVGCGDGRDAIGICELAGRYIGIDPSKGMLDLARQRLPKGTFELADALSFNYPPNVDLVFAFASLLHVNKHDLSEVMKKLAASVKSGGLVYMSLKEADQYQERVKKDDFGTRVFYYYAMADVLAVSRDWFEPVLEIHETIGTTRWFELGLRRR